MALDELHARRLATVASLLESSLERMGLVLKSIEASQENNTSRINAEQIQRARERMETIRKSLHQALERFSVSVTRPDPRQVLAAELSALWVILENSRPERMRGYGKDFKPQDKADWTRLIESLLREVEDLRGLSRGTEKPESDG